MASYRSSSFLIILLINCLLQINSIVQAKEATDPVIVFARDKAIFTKDHPLYAVLIESKESEDYDDHFEEFEFAAKHFGEKIKFVYLNTDVEKYWETIEFLGLIAEDVPTVMFIDVSKGLEKFKAEFDEITRKNIISFVQDCLDGKSVAFLKSDDVPKEWDAKPLKELVGQNFESIVYDQPKTSFVMFYAPWCKACQLTMPEVEKLADMYAGNEHVMIARMDATTNEISRMPVLDVPTLALFLNGDRKPLYYTDDRRTAEDFQRFINKKMKDAGLKTAAESEDEEKTVAKEEKEEGDKQEKIDEKKKSEKKVKKGTDTEKKAKKGGEKKKAKSDPETTDKKSKKGAKKETEPTKETAEKTKEAEKKKTAAEEKSKTEEKSKSKEGTEAKPVKEDEKPKGEKAKSEKTEKKSGKEPTGKKKSETKKTKEKKTGKAKKGTKKSTKSSKSSTKKDEL